MADNIGTTIVGYDYRYSPHGLSGVEYAGNQFVFACEGAEAGIGDLELHFLKSTDNGLSWNDLGSVVIGAVPSVCSCQIGSNVYILCSDTGVGTGIPPSDLCGPIVGWVFDLSAGTISSIALSGAPQVYKFWHGTTPNAYQISKCVGLSLVPRSAGGMWFLFQGLPSTAVVGSQFARLYVCQFNGTTFTAPVLMGGQTDINTAYTQGGVGVDVSGIMHVIFADITNRNRYHIGMSTAGVFGTRQTVETDAFFTVLDPPEAVSNLLSYQDSTINFIAFVDVNNRASSNGDIVIHTALGGSLNPVWTTTLVAADNGTNAPVVINPQMGSALSTSVQEINTFLFVFWTVSGFAPSWRVQDMQGRICYRQCALSAFGTWSAQGDFIVAPTPVLPMYGWAAAEIQTWFGPVNGVGAFTGWTGTTNFFGPGTQIELAQYSTVSPSVVIITVTVNTISGCFSAVGGVPPYTFVVSAGSLPPGMVLNPATGCITGTPGSTGTFPITVTATDSNGDSGHVDATLTVSSAGTGPGAGTSVLVCNSLCCYLLFGTVQDSWGMIPGQTLD